MSTKLFNRIILVTCCAAVFYIILAIYADFDLLLLSLSQFNLTIIPILLGLSLLNYISRFFKWHYYIRISEISLSISDSAMIFFSGLVMSISPAKLGELIKPYFVKQVSGEPLSKSIPVVFAERITDFASLVVLAIAGISFSSENLWIILMVGLFIVLMLIVLSNTSFLLKIVNIMGKIRFFEKYQDSLTELLKGISALVKPLPLFSMILLSAVSWFFECFALYLLLNQYEVSINILNSTFIYSFSTIVGALFFLPAGLGITEGSLTYLIANEGFSLNSSVLVTFIIRIATLWFAVLVGLFSLMLFRHKRGIEVRVDVESTGEIR